jgi:hypothetical protein
MRYVLLLPLLLLSLSGCTIVPIADAGPCSGTTNTRGCQEQPYVVKWEEQTTAESGSSQKAGTPR